ncbi:MAG: NAD(P)-binding domain-containing protein [Thermoplasmataceae archaeon]
MVLFINNKDQERLITPNEAIEALESGLREFSLGNGVRRPRFDMFIPTTHKGRYFCFSSMEGGIRRPGYYAIRIKPDIMSWVTSDGERRRETYNTEPGKYGGLVLLFSVENAALLAIMNDGFIQHLRVAATASLGAKFLSRLDSKVLGILGSGGMAHSFASCLNAVRKLDEVKIFSPKRDHAEAFAEEIKRDLKIKAVVKTSAEEVVRDSDIIASCTNSMTPTIKGEWISPGSHISIVARREVGNDVLKRVDKLGLLVKREPLSVREYFDQDFAIRNHVMSYAAGTKEEKDRIPKVEPVLDLFHAVYVNCIDWETGKVYSRDNIEEITMLSHESHGTVYSDAGASEGIQGIQFSSIGGKIYENAVSKGMGKEMPSEMFLQDLPT